MTRANPAHLERARRWLAHEGAAESGTTAAVRVYDKLHSHMAPLVGDAGVQLLLVRSAKVAKVEFPLAEGPILEGSPNLREFLQAQDPAVATELAAALFGTFFALVTTFIGERLTTQLLRRAWPTIEETDPKETNK